MPQTITRVEKQGGVFVVNVDGPLRADNVASLDHLLAPKLLGRMPSFVMDFHQIPTIDSRGLTWLVGFNEACCRRGGCLRLCRVGELCGDLLRVTGVASSIECYPDRISALASFA